MWNYLNVLEEPKLGRDPVLLVSVSTSNPQYQLLYSQARELASFLLRKLDFKLIASLYSSAMPPAITISGSGVVDLLSSQFHCNESSKRDFIVFSGYASPTSDEYEYADAVFSFAKRLGVIDMISVGARWAENPIPPLETPKVLGFASDPEGTRKLEENGVSIIKDETAFYFANLLVALAPRYGMRGYKLSVNHGEPRPHPRSVTALLEVLSKMIGFKVEKTELETQTKQLAEVIQKVGLENVARYGLQQEEEGGESLQQQGEAGERGIYR